MIWLAVALGGAVGGGVRVWVDHLLRPTEPDGFPRGIAVINIVGAFLLGVVTAWAPPLWWRTALGTGFCGALTTWSTFALDAVRLLHAHRPGRAAAYVAVSLIGGLIAAWAGLQVG